MRRPRTLETLRSPFSSNAAVGGRENGIRARCFVTDRTALAFA
jgi:hypothetical protein